MPYTHKPFPSEVAGLRQTVIKEGRALRHQLETCLSVGIEREIHQIYDELLPVITEQLQVINSQLTEILRWFPETGRRPKWWTNSHDAQELIEQAILDAAELEKSRRAGYWLVVKYLTGELLTTIQEVKRLMREVDAAPPDNPDRRRTPSKEIIIKQFEGLINQGRRNN